MQSVVGVQKNKTKIEGWDHELAAENDHEDSAVSGAGGDAEGSNATQRPSHVRSIKERRRDLLIQTVHFVSRAG